MALALSTFSKSRYRGVVVTMPFARLRKMHAAAEMTTCFTRIIDCEILTLAGEIMWSPTMTGMPGEDTVGGDDCGGHTIYIVWRKSCCCLRPQRWKALAFMSAGDIGVSGH
jgi:hypothetical protein